MRRHLLPILLALVTVLSGALAVGAGPAGGGASHLPPGPPAAPVLSARRVPGLVAQRAGERRLVDALGVLADRSPQPSCLVVSEGGRGLYGRHPDVPVIPASTMKLLTAAALLDHVDPEERLRTRVVATAGPADGVVAGDIWLVGGGDPLLGTADYFSRFRRQPQLRTPLEDLAEGLVASGLRAVQGRVVGDETRYDAARYVPSWKASYAASGQTGPLSALTVNDGFDMGHPEVAAFVDPAAGAAGVLTELLRRRGVTVALDPASGAAPRGAVELGAVASPTIAELVGQMLRESDNGTAELLLKELGARVAGEGTTAAGARVVAATLADGGLPVAGAVVVDGSGLDRGNRVTCRLLHEVLARAPADGPLVEGLAVAGTSGTLSRRMDGNPAQGRLRAKTGSIAQVNALAGVVESQGGFTLHFAQVLNGVGPGVGPFALQDELAHLLGGYPNLPAVEEIGPEGYVWQVTRS